MNYLTIIGYTLTILGYVSYWISRFLRKKSNMMIWNSISSGFFMFSHFMFHSFNGVVSSLLVVCRGFAVNYKEKKQSRCIMLFVLFIIAFTSSAILFWQGWASVCLTICMYLNLIINWFGNAQRVRFLTCIASIFYMVFLFCIGNYVGIFLEGTVIATNLGGYIKYKKEDKEKVVRV